MTGKYIKKKVKKFFIKVKSLPYLIRRRYNLKVIKSRDFTIISNNCWAGSVYRYFGMPYLSPTVGLYFFSSDYLKFVSDLRHYMSTELEFISCEESNYSEIIKVRNQADVPIARLDDVEIVFLHYKTEQEAKEKWDRRKERINWNNIFIKFSKMNCCTQEHLKRFSQLPFKNKFMFNTEKKTKYDCEYYWSGEHNENEIILDTKPFPGNLCLRKLLNRCAERYPE